MNEEFKGQLLLGRVIMIIGVATSSCYKWCAKIAYFCIFKKNGLATMRDR